MATYTCSKCGMAVNATCAKCDAPLENDTLKLDNGTEVQISKCPNGHGKIKSPMCCGEDMSCSLSFNSNRLAPIINKPIVGGPGNTYWVSARIIENFLSQVLD